MKKARPFSSLVILMRVNEWAQVLNVDLGIFMIDIVISIKISNNPDTHKKRWGGGGGGVTDLDNW